MRSFMVVVPDEILNRSAARREGEERANVKAFVIHSSEEPLDFAIRLRGVRPEHVMADAQGGARLLKSGQPLTVQRMTHRERKGVVGQHGLDGIRQGRRDVLQKAGRGHTRGLGPDRDNRFSAEIIDGGKFEVISGVSQRRQILKSMWTNSPGRCFS